MRVGLVVYGPLDTLSGGYLYDRRLVEHLRASGDEVEIFSMPRTSSYPGRLLHNLSARWLERLTRSRLDILLQDELNHPSLFLLNRLLRPRIGYPIVSIVHHLRCREPSALSPLYYPLERLYLQSVDGFIFNSHSTRQCVEDMLGKPAPWGIIAYPGGNRFDRVLAEEQIVAKALKPGTLRLAFIGNVIPRKGLGALIASLAPIETLPWELTIVGSLNVDPAYVREVRRQIDATAFSDKIRFRGSVSDAELAGILLETHLLAMPYAYEGFGIVYLEAMAFGVAALASQAGGASEIVEHIRSGFLVAPDEPITGIIRRLIENRTELSRLALGARKRFDAFPSWELTGSGIRDFLMEIVRGRYPAVHPALCTRGSP